MAGFAKERFPDVLEPKLVTSLSFDGIKSGPTDTDGMAINDTFLAYVDSSNANSSWVGVVPLSSTGNKRSKSLIKGHTSQVKDIAFDPFEKKTLVTCSTDATMKLWNIPEGGLLEDYSSAACSWTAKEKEPLRGVCFHPCVAGLVVSRSSRRLHLWDIVSNTNAKGGQLASTADGTYSGDMQSFCFTFGGEAVATTSKDKTLRLVDMRAPSSSQVVASAACHEGIRHSRVIQLGDHSLLTTGHGAGGTSKTRQMSLWDTRRLDSSLKDPLSSAVKTIEYDTGANYGNQLIPLFDSGDETGRGLLFIAAKGEKNANIYQTSNGDVSLLHEEVGMGTQSTSGACLVPRQALRHYDDEVARVLQLTAGSIKALSVRGKGGKDDDGTAGPRSEWYPPTTQGAPPSAELTVGGYMAGGNTAPNRIPIELCSAADVKSGEGGGEGSLKSAPRGVGSGSSSVKMGKQPTGLELDAEERIRAAIEAEEASMRARRSSEVSGALATLTLGSNRQSQFRYMRCDEGRLKDSYLDLRVSANPLLGDCPLATASESLWAFPWEGTGGRVFVSDFSNPCKVPASPLSLINCHAGALSDLSFSPFHADLLATAGSDCMLKVWRIPPPGATNALDALSSWTDTDAVLVKRLDSPVQTILWHPVVPDLVACTTHENTVYVLSLDGTVLFQHTIEAATSSIISNISFHPTGTLIAAACKDNRVRVVDPSQAKAKGASATIATSCDIGRNLRVVWCGSDAKHDSPTCLVTVSAQGNNRVVCAWNPSSLDEALAKADVDAASGQLYPMYDSSSQLVFVVGKGDSTLRTFDLRVSMPDAKLAATVQKCAEYASTDSRVAWAGVCMLPKHSCDVKAVQIARIVKISKDRMTQLSFIMPRSDAQKGYFQDELYGDIPSWHASEAPSAENYRSYVESGGSRESVSKLEPAMKTLCPADMIRATEAAAASSGSAGAAGAAGVQVNAYKAARIREKEEQAVKDDNFSKLRELAIQRAANHPNKSMGGNDDDSSDGGWSD